MKPRGGTIVVIAYLAASCLLLGYLLRDALDAFSFDASTRGAIAGGLIAGFLGLGGTLLAVWTNTITQKGRDRAEDSALIQSIVSRAIDLQDIIEKSRRHFWTYEPTSIVRFAGGGQESFFHKPLEGVRAELEFSLEERAFALRAGNADFFNAINEANRIAQNFLFLEQKHREAYYALMAKYQQSDIVRKGYLIAGEIEKDSPHLMEMMDCDGHLRSLLYRSGAPILEFLHSAIRINNTISENAIQLNFRDIPSASENSERREY